MSNLKTLWEMLMGPKDSYHKHWHVACACSAELNMCGGFVPGQDGVDRGASIDDPQLCPPCKAAWMKDGCPRCPCGPWGLCQACLDCE